MGTAVNNSLFFSYQARQHSGFCNTHPAANHALKRSRSAGNIACHQAIEGKRDGEIEFFCELFGNQFSKRFYKLNTGIIKKIDNRIFRDKLFCIQCGKFNCLQKVLCFRIDKPTEKMLIKFEKAFEVMIATHSTTTIHGKKCHLLGCKH